MSRLALAAAFALAAASPVAAKTLPKVPPALDPAKAYILVEYRLLKNPYGGGLPGSRKTMPLKSGLVFGRYDPALGDIRGMGKARVNPVAPGQQAVEGFRSKPLAKGAGSRLFLIELDPDIWVVQGFGNTSFSLGSYRFELTPGSVTDLGVVAAEPDWAEGQDPPDMGSLMKSAFAGPFGKSPDIAPMRATFHPRAAGDIPLPAGIPTDKVRPVAFTPGARFGNYLGGLVNKIEGVNASLRKPHWTSSTNK